MTVRGSAAPSLSCSIAGALHYEIQQGGPKRGSCKRFLQTASGACSGSSYRKGLRTGSEPSGATGPRGPDDSDGQRCSVPGGGDGGWLRQDAAGAGGLAFEELQAPAHARTHARARTHTPTRARARAQKRAHHSRADGHISIIDFHHWQVLSLGIGSAYLAAVSCDVRVAREYAQAPTRTAARTRKGARAAQRAHAPARTQRGRTRTHGGGFARRRLQAEARGRFARACAPQHASTRAPRRAHAQTHRHSAGGAGHRFR